jgi:outer membrane protein TolC
LFLPSIANANAEAADRNADEVREQILLRTSRTYLTLQGLEGLLEAAREAEKVALRREQDARARIAAGTEVEIALLRAQTETAGARVQIANRQGQKETLLPLLEALTGEPIEPVTARVFELPPSGEETAQPWENAYSVRSAMASAQAAHKSVRYDQFLWLPSVSAALRENYNSNGGLAEKNWTSDLLLNISVPIYDRGLRYAQLAEDRARLMQAQAQLAAARARARSNWLGARANLIASTAVVQQTESTFQLASRTHLHLAGPVDRRSDALRGAKRGGAGAGGPGDPQGGAGGGGGEAVRHLADGALIDSVRRAPRPVSPARRGRPARSMRRRRREACRTEASRDDAAIR